MLAWPAVVARVGVAGVTAVLLHRAAKLCPAHCQGGGLEGAPGPGEPPPRHQAQETK